MQSQSASSFFNPNGVGLSLLPLQAPRPRFMPLSAPASLSSPLQKDAFQKVSLHLLAQGHPLPVLDFVDAVPERPDSPKAPVAAPDLAKVEQGKALLQAGQQGEAVKTLQRLLSAAGYPLEADGDFGELTEGKLKHFQKDHGITINGHLGKTTLTALKAAADKNVSATAAGRLLVQKSKQVVREMGTVGWCYTGVARSVSRAFGVELYGESAYMADSQLRRSSRFKEVKNVSVQDLEKMPAGTVVVWDRAPARSGNRGRGGGWDHGHIAVLDGKGGEYSDHYRPQMFAPHYAGGALKGVFVPV